MAKTEVEKKWFAYHVMAVTEWPASGCSEQRQEVTNNIG